MPQAKFGANDRTAGVQKDSARTTDGTPLPRGLSGDCVPRRLCLYVGASRKGDWPTHQSNVLDANAQQFPTIRRQYHIGRSGQSRRYVRLNAILFVPDRPNHTTNFLAGSLTHTHLSYSHLDVLIRTSNLLCLFISLGIPPTTPDPRACSSSCSQCSSTLSSLTTQITDC